jgi:DNA repair exonuclease SbcCD ATPase subunit
MRKSPERKLEIFAQIITRAAFSEDFGANWKLGQVPELQLAEVEEMPSKPIIPLAEEPRPETRTSAPRAETPGKKRLLEVDNQTVINKRQRLTPTSLRDSVEASNGHVVQPASLLETVHRIQAELAAEKEARQKLEQEKKYLQEQVEQWRSAHAALQLRFEKKATKLHESKEENTKLLKNAEYVKSRSERLEEENSTLKQKTKSIQEELTGLRQEVKSGGGDAAALETARDEARKSSTKNTYLEKSLANAQKDFEFTRTQYQEASNKAAEFATQIRELEERNAELARQASDEKRRLKEINQAEAIKQHVVRLEAVQLELKSRDALLRKLEEENRQFKRTRGVQTRGSSVQPPGSPSLDTPGRGPRSRQSSPAPGLVAHHATGTNRGSLLRHER